MLDPLWCSWKVRPIYLRAICDAIYTFWLSTINKTFSDVIFYAPANLNGHKIMCIHFHCFHWVLPSLFLSVIKVKRLFCGINSAGFWELPCSSRQITTHKSQGCRALLFSFITIKKGRIVIILIYIHNQNFLVRENSRCLQIRCLQIILNSNFCSCDTFLKFKNKQVWGKTPMQ